MANPSSHCRAHLTNQLTMASVRDSGIVSLYLALMLLRKEREWSRVFECPKKLLL